MGATGNPVRGSQQFVRLCARQGRRRKGRSSRSTEQEWVGDTAVYNKFFHNAVKERGTKTETGVLIDRYTASKEARGALEVLGKSAKRYQEQADPQWRSALGGGER